MRHVVRSIYTTYDMHHVTIANSRHLWTILNPIIPTEVYILQSVSMGSEVANTKTTKQTVLRSFGQILDREIQSDSDVDRLLVVYILLTEAKERRYGYKTPAS